MTDLEKIEKSPDIQMVQTALRLCAGLRIIHLTREKCTVVDIQDYEQLSKNKWHAIKCNKRFVAGRWAKESTILMHREALGFPDSESIDHINGDSLDNRKSNLRLCTHAQNTWNTGPKKNSKTGMKGVYSCRDGFEVRIRHNGKITYLGFYKDLEKAGRAYDKGALEYHGEFAYLNFPDQDDIGRVEKVLEGEE